MATSGEEEYSSDRPTRLVVVVEALGELEVPAVATSGEEEDSSARPREGTTAATTGEEASAAEGLEVE